MMHVLHFLIGEASEPLRSYLPIVVSAEVTESVTGDTPSRTPFDAVDSRTFFREKKVFNADYIPERIFSKEEFKHIIQFYYDALKFQLQQHMLVLGPSGVGKTMGCKYYGRLAIQYARDHGIDFSALYLNCRDISSPYAFWRSLLSDLDIRAPKGLGISDLVDRFVEAIEHQHHVVLILDEADKLYTGFGERGNDVLYTLTRAKSSRDLDTAISLILTANNTHIEEHFDGPVKSSMNLKRFALGQYDAEQIYQIIRHRASAGLKKDVWTERLIRFISAKTANQFEGDARAGIRLLYNSAVRAEARTKRKITERDVTQSVEMTLREAEVDVVERLTDNQLFTLKAIAEATGKRKAFVKVNDVYKNVYQPLCARYSAHPLAYSNFFNNTISLSNYDLVNNLLERRRSGGHVRIVELNVRPEIVEEIFKGKMEG